MQSEWRTEASARATLCASSDPTPMSHSNNDGQLSAESGEGRLLIKENVCQPDTLSTQSEIGVSYGLVGVRKAARESIPRFASPLFIRDKSRMR